MLRDALNKETIQTLHQTPQTVIEDGKHQRPSVFSMLKAAAQIGLRCKMVGRTLYNDQDKGFYRKPPQSLCNEQKESHVYFRNVYLTYPLVFLVECGSKPS